MQLLNFFLPGIAVGVAALLALVVIKRLKPDFHEWFVAKPDRIATLGIVLLVLAWVAIAVYNNIHGSAA